MYQIDPEENRINKLESKSFSQMGFRERDHLQEWIAKDPSCLGEELLIIQKEFDGFQNTRERLDLLALDKEGKLVIIENKLDDSGRDVTWQSLKYASYCSSLSKDEIRRIFQAYIDSSGQTVQAEDLIIEFLQKEDFEEVQLNPGHTQRVILVAAKFRREVTSTILWLQNFNLRIQCIKVAINILGDKLLLSFDQILPVKDIEEYAISMASKNQEEIVQQEGLKERHRLRLKFWAQLIEASGQNHGLFAHLSPSKDSAIGTGIGMGGIRNNIVVGKDSCRGEIYISTGDKIENKRRFDFLWDRKDQLEAAFGEPFIWERLDEKSDCRIKAQLDGVSLYEREDWQQMIAYLLNISTRIDKAFRPVIKELNRK